MQQSPSTESMQLAMRVCQSPVLSKGSLKFEGLLNQSVLLHATNSLSKPLNLQKLLGQVIFEDDSMLEIIGHSAFSQCKLLEAIIITKSVKIIDKN